MAWKVSKDPKTLLTCIIHNNKSYWPTMGPFRYLRGAQKGPLGLKQTLTGRKLLSAQWHPRNILSITKHTVWRNLVDIIPFDTLSDPLSILRGPNGTLYAPKTALLDPLKTPQEPERAKIGLKLFQILIWAGSTDMIPFCFLSYHFGIPRDLLKGVLGLLKPPKGHIWTFSPTGKFRLGCTYVK